ncbi:MAG: hypothetical protein JWQ03_1353 [Variovorax sp.]|nr:hypothetical protein [Variovorax sp.]
MRRMRSGVFGHQAVLLLAQQQSDGRLVVGRLHLSIDGRQVEVELPRVSGLKAVAFSSTTT